jgi:hypothetical protein
MRTVEKTATDRKLIHTAGLVTASQLRRVGTAPSVARWKMAGMQLRQCDPQRFDAILKLAERVVSIHRDPMSVPIAASRRRGRRSSATRAEVR